jgi:Predicted transcriptional regulator
LGCVENLWYLFAFDLDRGELRTFALPRIRNVRVSKTKFRRPMDFSIGRYLEQSFGVFARPTKTKHTIRIAFDSFAAPLVQNGNGIRPKRSSSCETAALSCLDIGKLGRSRAVDFELGKARAGAWATRVKGPDRKHCVGVGKQVRQRA